MKLTIEQAMWQGVTAHKAGKLQEAEHFYQAVLESEPEHADANHNLGLIAVSVNQIEAALPLFKNALNVNSNNENFWISYIDALAKAKHLKDAKRAIKKAKKKGIDSKKLQALLSQSTGIVKSTAPSEHQVNCLLEHYKKRRFDEAENLAISIIKEFPKHQFSWKVLGTVLSAKGKKADAINAFHKALEISPQDAEAHNNLGVVLYELGKLHEAEAVYNQAITFEPDHALSHNNLGNTLKQLGKLKEAEASYKQAIALKPDYADAHSNLGVTLEERGRLDEAEQSYIETITLEPDHAIAHNNLGVLHYQKGDVDSALTCFEKAFKFDRHLRIAEVRSLVLQSRAAHTGGFGNSKTQSKFEYGSKLQSVPIILSRAVEIELVEKLYEMRSQTLDSTPDSRFGEGTCSINFQLFENQSNIIKIVSSDLIRISGEALKSKIYVYDSFFNILGAGGGSHPHNHLKTHDNALDLWRHKYSLVYYLSVGDQNCSEPGVLKLYNPAEDILPHEGMIVIVPATRHHSAVYGGRADRIMIGVNFYSL